jgi:AraC-like DNA-binding protein/quercetin dioxygenase-like cupin family protein
MVKNGHQAELAYRDPTGTPLGVEVMSFAQVRAAGPLGPRSRPHRPRFHVLGVVHHGTGHHTVDFTYQPLGAGSVLWIRPGVVHQFDGIEHVEGTVVLFQPDLLTPDTIANAAATDAFGPACWQQPGETAVLALFALDHLRREYAEGRAEPVPAKAEVVRHLLAVLVLRLLPPDLVRSGGAVNDGDDVFQRFRATVERDFTRCHQVAEYAAELGCAPRTLSRATLAVAGVGAKQFLDNRVVLEAKRLLGHDGLSAARCAERLGFDDPANFSKFFQRNTGVSPATFKAAYAEKPASPTRSRRPREMAR